MNASPTVSYGVPARSFCKWAGGKASLLPEILEHVPKTFKTYYEPFVGGGAVFFALHNESRFRKAVLNDTNERLMTTYGAIKKDPERLISRLRLMKNDAETFARVRARKFGPTDAPHHTAAWLIYLNKTCFNGLYRVNKKNEFNTPFGRYKNPTICDATNLRACSLALANAKLLSDDFATPMSMARAGDFIYADPPYLRRVGNEFVAYGKDHFGIDEHIRLRDSVLQLKALGVHVLISNSGADEIRELYASRKFKIHEVRGRRSISAGGEHRGHMPDLLIT